MSSHITEGDVMMMTDYFISSYRMNSRAIGKVTELDADRKGKLMGVEDAHPS